MVIDAPWGSYGRVWMSIEMMCAGLRPYSTYQLRAACFNNMGSAASNWTTVTTLSEGTTSIGTPNLQSWATVTPIPSLHSLQLHSICPHSWWTVTLQWSGWTGRGPSPSTATWESSVSWRASWGSILVSTANYRFPVLHRKVRHTYLLTTM